MINFHQLRTEEPQLISIKCESLKKRNRFQQSDQKMLYKRVQLIDPTNRVIVGGGVVGFPDFAIDICKTRNDERKLTELRFPINCACGWNILFLKTTTSRLQRLFFPVFKDLTLLGLSPKRFQPKSST